MQPGEVWDAHDPTCTLNGTAVWRVLSKRQMRADAVVVAKIRSENVAKVRFVEDDQMVEALAAD